MKERIFTAMKIFVALFIVWYVSYCAVDGVVEKLCSIFGTNVFWNLREWFVSVIIFLVVMCLALYVFKSTMRKPNKVTKKRKVKTIETLQAEANILTNADRLKRAENYDRNHRQNASYSKARVTNANLHEETVDSSNIESENSDIPEEVTDSSI